MHTFARQPPRFNQQLPARARSGARCFCRAAEGDAGKGALRFHDLGFGGALVRDPEDLIVVARHPSGLVPHSPAPTPALKKLTLDENRQSGQSKVDQSRLTFDKIWVAPSSHREMATPAAANRGAEKRNYSRDVRTSLTPYHKQHLAPCPFLDPACHIPNQSLENHPSFPRGCPSASHSRSLTSDGPGQAFQAKCLERFSPSSCDAPTTSAAESIFGAAGSDGSHVTTSPQTATESPFSGPLIRVGLAQTPAGFPLGS